MLRLLAVLIIIASAGTAFAQRYIKPGEELVFSFRTGNNKKVVVARDSDDTYLVYRFGTDKKIEMQYPPKPDSTNLKNFSYAGIIRGVSFEGTDALDLNYLTFYNDHYQYIIYDQCYDNACTIGIKIEDTITRKMTRIPGIYKTKKGDLSGFRWDDRVQQHDGTYED